MLHADEHDIAVQQVSLRNNSLTPTAVDSCGEGCARLESGMEATGGSLPTVSDISIDTDVLQTAISVTTQVDGD